AERHRNGTYGVVCARIALASPRTVLAGAAVLTVLCVAAIVRTVAADPLEYDFRKLQAERAADSRVLWVNERLAGVIEETRAGGALACPARPPQAAPAIRAQLTALAARDPHAIGDVRSIDDLLPTEQDAKLPVLRDLRRLALEIRPHAPGDAARAIDENLPPADVA